MANIDTKRILTTKDFARLLGDGTKPDTIRKYCYDGEIVAEQIGRTWVISWDEYERFVRERQPVGRPRST